MKKIIISLVSLSLVVTIVSFSTVKANDFAENEEKYMELCSSTSLSTSQIDTCRDFNSYLEQKSDTFKDEAAKSQEVANQASDDLKTTMEELEKVETNIVEVEEEITYLNTSITNLQADITEKEELIKDRMYAMQSYTNNDFFVQFIFGAEDFVDMFSRVESINELTEYDKELISGLQDDYEMLDGQLNQVEDAKIYLESQRQTQLLLKQNYEEQYNIALAAIEQNAAAGAATDANQEVVMNAIATSFDKINSTPSSGGTVTPAPGTGSGSSSGTEGTVTPGDSVLGNAIAEKALTRLGSLYWWGAPGGGYGDGQGLDNPNAIYFDCSGLVAWAHRQSGVMIGRTTASGYSASGVGVSYSELQPGDVITFNGGGSGHVYHIAIYIGGGQAVHASGYGSSVLGNRPDNYVRVDSVATLDKYFGIYNYRRLY